MSVINARNFKGTRDFMPGQMIPREMMITKMKRIFRLYGFSPLETPALELLQVLSGKYGKESEKLLYKLDYKNDRPKDRVALRYDLTVPLARVVAMHPEWPMPFKRYQVQPVWRADKPQPHQGRFREFYQCDVDTIGAEEGIADAEIIALSVTMLEELGFTGDGREAVILLNHRRILEALCIGPAGLNRDKLPDFCRALDKLDKDGWDSVEEELRKIGVSTESLERLNQALCNDETDTEKLNRLTNHGLILSGAEAAEEGVQGIEKILLCLEGLGISRAGIRFEPRLARGLDYYTGTVFETILPDHPHIGSLTGGGRYDKLIGLYSGRDLPAVGTTIGLDRIFAAMEQLGMVDSTKNTVTRVLIAAFSENEMEGALRIAGEFRRSGVEAEIFPTTGKLKKPFSYADKIGIPFVAVVGPDEIADPDLPKVTLKNLSLSTQETLTIAEAIRKIGNP